MYIRIYIPTYNCYTGIAAVMANVFHGILKHKKNTSRG